MEQTLVNRVAQSKLHTINLENFYPKQATVHFDLKDYLFHGLILKEKDFRIDLKAINWSSYDNTIVLLYCSTDAIIPVWAYMLVSQYLVGHAAQVFMGSETEFLKNHYYKVLSSMDFEQYDGEKVVIKGCSDKPVPPSAYAFLTGQLQPYAQSIMYGEPCSTVPIFKRPRKV